MAKASHYITGKSDEELIGHIGFGESVKVDFKAQKKVLITGSGSYIGESFEKYAAEHYSENFLIDDIDMLDPAWRKRNFSDYDIVYHVAGIAHADVGKADAAEKTRYYVVNTDLAVEVAEKAKADRVKVFVFMSSMIIYGAPAPYGKNKIINEHTVPKATNFYGDSKLQADVAVRNLADDKFKVIVLRPPMIYGRGSKGNYSLLSKIVKKLPVFPRIDNERSMLYIDNFCEFLCQIMLVNDIKINAIVLFPQNKEWTSTSNMVYEIAKVIGKNIRILSSMKIVILLGSKIPGNIGALINKAFGNAVYFHSISEYEGINYNMVDFNKSINNTESNAIKKKL